LRGKDDYGIMVLADRRFQKKRTQLPRWIAQAMPDAETNLSTEQAVAVARRFLKDMSVPFEGRMQEGISNWGIEDLKRHQAKMQEAEIAELQARRDVEMVEEEEVMQGPVVAQGEDDYGMDDVDEDALMELNA